VWKKPNDFFGLVILRCRGFSLLHSYGLWRVHGGLERKRAERGRMDGKGRSLKGRVAAGGHRIARGCRVEKIGKKLASNFNFVKETRQ